MLEARLDSNLVTAGRICNTDLDTLDEMISAAIDMTLPDDEADPYAGETLGNLVADYPQIGLEFVGIFTQEQLDALGQIRLMLVNEWGGCPECGWEVSEREEDHMIICPHCGWSRPMFLSEQNDE